MLNDLYSKTGFISTYKKNKHDIMSPIDGFCDSSIQVVVYSISRKCRKNVIGNQFLGSGWTKKISMGLKNTVSNGVVRLAYKPTYANESSSRSIFPGFTLVAAGNRFGALRKRARK